MERQASLLPIASSSQLIENSWRRCLLHGMTSSRRSEPSLLTATELLHQQQKHFDLRRLALREMDLLQRAIFGTGRVVLLASSDGVILDIRGDEGFLGRARRVSLQPGASWQEGHVGTNAIGTALVESRFVRVLGKQHFLEENRFLVCDAMPVMTPDGEVGGILDMSGDSREAFAPGGRLIRNAVAHIEHDWVAHLTESDLVVRFHLHPSWLGTPEEGVLAFRDHLLIGASPRAMSLLGLSKSAIQTALWHEIFDQGPAIGSCELQPIAGRGLYFAEVTPLTRRSTLTTEKRAADTGKNAVAVRDGIVWDSVTSPLLEKAKRAMQKSIPILLQGETGTGKEVFVQMLHREMSEKQAPLVAVNCAAIPEGLLESELFGYEEGAFTGARRNGSAGHIRRAHGGTLFLDEIGDMPLSLQAQLLRVLQNGEVTPLGGGRPVRVNFRLVAATHQDLQQAIREHRFREDLYYRLCHLSITLPPLRERPDLPETLDALLMASEVRQRGISLSPEARNILLHYSWPGNLREMSSMIHMLVSLADDLSTIQASALPEAVRAQSAAQKGSLEDMRQSAFRSALAANRGNVSAAARQLGLNRSTLYRRMRGL